MLHIYEVILVVVRELRPFVSSLAHVDPDLARQMRRALTSVALNVAEGMGSRGKLRAARYHTALGSARETLSCIEVSGALLDLPPPSAETLDKLRKVIGTLVNLTR